MTSSYSIQEALNSKRMLIMDGAMGTEIQKRGVDCKDCLWSSVSLLTNPKVTYDVHKEYFEAGADITITNTYHASIGAF